MRTSDKIDAALLAELFHYDAQSGKLFRKPRGPEWFCDSSRCSKHQSAAWNSRFAGKEFGSVDKRGYIWGSLISSSCVSAHSIVWALHYGEWPEGVIDHIDGDTSNNRIKNLRCVPQSVNSKNLKVSKANTSGFAGVGADKRTGKWRAFITVDGKRVNLGFYATIGEAAAARKMAEEKHGFISRGRNDEGGCGDTKSGGHTTCSMDGRQRSQCMSAMQPISEKEERSLPEHYAQTGRDSVELLALSVLGRGILR